MALTLTVPLSQVQTLIFIFPTLLFYISLLARSIITFSKVNDPLQTAFDSARDFLNNLVSGGSQLRDTSIGDFLNRATESFNQKKSDNSNNWVKFVKESNKRRDKHYLFGIFIDSFALSLANGVIIMFQSDNLITGFLVLFVGVITCVIGFATIYAGSSGGASFVAYILLFGVLLSELIFLLTSNPMWLIRAPEFFAFITVIGVAVILAYEKLKTKRTQKDKPLEEGGLTK